MNVFPPPDPTSAAAPDPAPDSPPNRRRLALAAAVATTLGVGGIVAGAQLAGASADQETDEAPPTTQVEEPADTSVTDEEPSDDSADEPADEPDADVETIDVEPVDLDVGIPGLPDLDEFEAEFAEFGACLAEQLPDLFGDGAIGDVMGGWFDDAPDTVTVYAGGDGDDVGEFTVLDLGDGDGSITITKTDGVVDVSSEGDVQEFNEADFEAQFDDFEANIDEIDAAHEACADLMPNVDIDFGEFGDIDLGEFGDIEFGEFDLGDINLGDINLGDMDFEDFDLGDLEDFDFDDFGHGEPDDDDGADDEAEN